MKHGDLKDAGATIDTIRVLVEVAAYCSLASAQAKNGNAVAAASTIAAAKDIVLHGNWEGNMDKVCVSFL